MKILFSKITSFLLVLTLLTQVSMFTIVSYFYTNYNEVLTASCCVNKDVDDSCKAKCFFDETEEKASSNKSAEMKKVEVVFCEEYHTIELLDDVVSLKDDVYFYNTEYSFLYGRQFPRPPIS